MKKIKHLSSVQIVLLGFLTIILLGSALLVLPVSSATGTAVSYIDALFTATTATCVTGLVTVPTAGTWSVFGQVVILLLIQIGGLGVVTVGAGLMIIAGKKIGIDKQILISDSFNLNSLSGIVRFVKRVIALTVLTELIGALGYMTVFVPEFGIRGIWISVFNAVSAFCNAGMDIIGENSLCDYALNPVINIVTNFLIITGGLGFIVLFELGQRITSRRRNGFLSLHTKIVLVMTSLLVAGGAVLIFIFEYDNPLTFGPYSFPEKIMLALFQSVTTRTAGFMTVPQENFTTASAFLSMLLMFTGGSPIGTAGGIKTVTVFVLLVYSVTVVNNKRTADVFNRQISAESLKKAVAVVVVSFAVMTVSTVFILMLSDRNLTDVLYETVSATATVGLTRGFTPTLGIIGKLVIIITMYLGRVGPVSLAFAFGVNRSNENIITNPVEEIIVG